MPRSLRWYGGAALLFLVHLASAYVLTGGSGAVNQAIFWLPTGVAISGLWLLGLEGWWVVALSTVTQRLLASYYVPAALPAAVGSAAEAVAGVLVLRYFGFRPSLSRLRDTLALFAAAVVAPIGSVLFSWLSRQLSMPEWRPPFYSGWDGWWRMNALGVLTVVPVVLTWVSAPVARLRLRTVAEAGAMVVAIAGLLWWTMKLVPSGPTGIVVLFLVLPVALYAGVRFGPRGAASSAALAALVVALATTHGMGPFLAVPFEERHTAIQVFELTLVAVPLVFGALIAEREASVRLQLESEGLRQALLKLLPDITYRISASGTFLDCFAPEGIKPPYRREELVGRSVTDLAPPGLAAKMLAAIRAAHEGGRPDPLEYRLEIDEGLRVREARYIRLSDGEVLGVVRDITERKRAERLLGWQAEILELIATGRPTPEIFEALVRGIESFTDRGICSILQLRGRQVHVACAPGLPAAYNAAIEGIEVGPNRGSCGTAAHENRTVVVSDIATDPLWAEYRAVALPHDLRACWSVPIRSAGGAVLGTFAIYYRTPRAPEPAEISLVERAAVLAGIAMDRERREDLLASINRNVNEGIYRSTPDRGLVYVNQAFARMFGYDSPEEVLRLPSALLYDDPERREEMKRLIAERGQFVSEEVRFRRRDGSAFWGLVSSTGVRGPDGSVTHYDGAIADISVRKELEEQLRQAQKMEAVGKLAGGVAHDFNNLLTAISGYAEAIREAVPPVGELRSDVEEVLKAAERAASLTRQLLAYSRQQVLSPQVLDLTVVVEHLGAMLRRLIGEDIGLVTQHAPGESWVRVDRGQLEQVILNLVVNARDAMPGGGTLTITTAPIDVDRSFARAHVDLSPGPHVALAVRDTGIGMTPEVQTRAFDPFFTTKEQGKGTGLGLSTVYGILKQSGGAVWLESASGAGTTVWIYLPQVGGLPEVPPAAERASTGRVCATVLVVEDERLVRDLVRRTLTRAGYVVLAAEDGVAALDLARAHRGEIDLLVTDVVMPRMGGRELADRLTTDRAGLRVLFMSGYASDARDLSGATGGSGEFLQKPFAPSGLLERVGALLSPGRVGA